MSVSLLFLKVFLSHLNMTFSHVRCRFWRYFIHRADVGKSLSVDKRFLETTRGDFCHCRHTEQVLKQQFGLTFRCLPSTSVHLWFYGDLWHILVISFYCTKHNELSTCRSSAAALEWREREKQSFINDSKSNLGPGHGGGVFFVVVIKKKKQKRVRTKYLEKTTRTISSWGFFFFKKRRSVWGCSRVLTLVWTCNFPQHLNCSCKGSVDR